MPPALIANPNCSTIIALMAVTPLHRARRRRADGRQHLPGRLGGRGGARGRSSSSRPATTSPAVRCTCRTSCDRPYLFNLFSHDSAVGPDGYNEEERKLIRETAKIWDDRSPRVTATCIRVPVLRAHSEAITLTLREPLAVEEARRILSESAGVRVVDDPAANRFPEPIEASGRDEILVGRIRADASQPEGHGLHLFVAGDQLRKGAALNAIQIAERLTSQGVGRRSVTTTAP